MLMILLPILSVIRHLMWQQLELASELESDLQDTVDWGKTQLVSFDRSNNNASIDVKMNGSFPQEKSSFKMLGLTFSSKLDSFYEVSFS